MKEIVVDQFGDLSLFDVPAMIFAMIASAMIVYLLGFSLAHEDRTKVRWRSMFLAALVTAAVTVVKGSLPLAVAFAGILILANGLLADKDQSGLSRSFLLLALVIGLICGARAVMVAVVAAVPIYLLLLLYARKSS